MYSILLNILHKSTKSKTWFVKSNKFFLNKSIINQAKYFITILLELFERLQSWKDGNVWKILINKCLIAEFIAYIMHLVYPAFLNTINNVNYR